FGEEVVPVCSPSLLAKTVRKPQELLNYPLLHSTTRPDAWSRWFANLGVEDSATMHGVRYELHSMLISAAAAGLGIALVPKFFVDEQLPQLGLMIPFAATAVEESAYYLVYPTELSHGKPLELFRTWLLEQA
ncbi:LysR substrate-binding domain-containing protein, partial [Mesorhizobium sp. M1C.F.Ca.ET.176.01.1.1]